MASCSSLQLLVAGSLHGHANVCARFPLSVRGERYRDGYVAHLPSSWHRQSAENCCSHSPAGSPGCSCSKMSRRKQPVMWGVCHGSRSAVNLFAGPWCLVISTVPSSLMCIESIRPSVLVKRSCKLCRLFFLQSAMPHMLRSRARPAPGNMDWM